MQMNKGSCGNVGMCGGWWVLVREPVVGFGIVCVCVCVCVCLCVRGIAFELCDCVCVGAYTYLCVHAYWYVFLCAFVCV